MTASLAVLYFCKLSQSPRSAPVALYVHVYTCTILASHHYAGHAQNNGDSSSSILVKSTYCIDGTGVDIGICVVSDVMDVCAVHGAGSYDGVDCGRGGHGGQLAEAV